MVKKVYYGISQKTGKILIFGDQDNFPKKKPDYWAWTVTICCLLAVMVSAVIMLSPRVPIGR